MATPIKRIEKEYYLKAVFDNKLPLKCYYERAEYVFTLEKITKDEMWFHMNRPIGQLKPKDNLDFMFEYQGHKIFFTVGIRSVKDTYLVSGIPDSIYQNLNRSFSRIHIPSELRVQLSFLGDRYYLSYPQIVTVEPEKISSFFKNFDLHNFSELINQMAKWINGYASGYKLVFFKNVTPNSVEEQVIADTGKILYLPSKSANLPPDRSLPPKTDHHRRNVQALSGTLRYGSGRRERCLRPVCRGQIQQRYCFRRMGPRFIPGIRGRLYPYLAQ